MGAAPDHKFLIPPHAAAHHTRSLVLACQRITQELGQSATTAILLGGSVAADQARADSDLDLFVTWDGNWSQRRRDIVDGIEVDLFIDPSPLIEGFISGARNEVMIYNYAAGWIVYDPRGFAQRMKATAQRVLRHPRIPNEAQVYSQVGRARDQLKAVQRAASSDSVLASFLLGMLMMESIDAYYCLQRAWRPAPRHVPDDLKRRDPKLYKLFCACASEVTISERVQSVVEFAEAVLQLGPSEDTLRIGPKVSVPLPQTSRLTIGERVIIIPRVPK